MTPEDGAAHARVRRAVVRGRQDAVVGRLERLGTAVDDAPAPDFRAAARSRLVAMAAVRSPEPPGTSPSLPVPPPTCVPGPVC